jgi:hypothetical protein
MSSPRRPVTAFILSLIGGVLILANGAVMFTFWGSSFGWMMSGLGGMMGGYQGMMGSLGFPFGFMQSFMFVGLVSGIIIMIGAVMLNARPSEHFAWGVIILVFSVISFLGMGGFIVGAILGIIGGTFAISWKSMLPSTA